MMIVSMSEEEMLCEQTKQCHGNNVSKSSVNEMMCKSMTKSSTHCMKASEMLKACDMEKCHMVALKLFNMKIAKTFEECLRVVIDCNGDEKAAINQICEKH
jgi:hypothetical protein